MKVSVRYTAIGSFMPDSISSVVDTRSLSSTPEDFSRENTAAASVEPTIDPSNNDSGQLSPSNQCAAAPVMPAHTTTPTVASHMAGFRPMRKVAKSVRSPPSSKITATPASVPATRNTSKNENPTRAENTPASTLTNTSAAAISSGRVRKSRLRAMGRTLSESGMGAER